MKAAIYLVFILLTQLGLYGDEEALSKLQNSLNISYRDAEQISNEVMARGRLIEEGFKSATSRLDYIVPEMDNLLFVLRRSLEPSLDIRRQAQLSVKYQAEFQQNEKAVREVWASIPPSVKEMCEQIDKWKKKGLPEAKRGELLDQSRRLLQTVVDKVQKIQDGLDKANKALAKLSSLRNEVVTFKSKLDQIVTRADGLVPARAEALQIWTQEQPEVATLPLKIKSLESIASQSSDIAKTMLMEELSKEDVRYLNEQVNIISDFAKNAKVLNERLQDASRQIEGQIARFDAAAISFKDLGLRILAPFNDGLPKTLDGMVHTVEAQQADIIRLKEESLNDVNNLRACIGAIEYESDLVIVPDIKGLTLEDALTNLNRLRLKPDQKSGDPAPQRAVSGKVYEQSPADDQKVLPGSPVMFRVYGPYNPIVPDVVGNSVEEAKDALSERGLKSLPKLGQAADTKENEGKVYQQFPRAYSSAEDGGIVELIYYAAAPVNLSDEKFSSTPFYVHCHLYVPKLKSGAPRKHELTINDVDFVKRAAPFFIAIQEKALDRYSLTFFEANKAFSAYIQIKGKEVKSGQSYQYDGALLFEAIQIFHSFEDLKQQFPQFDFSSQDPLAFLKLTQGSGLFNGTAIQEDVELSWRGGPLINAWSPRIKEASFSLFRQLL